MRYRPIGAHRREDTPALLPGMLCALAIVVLPAGCPTQSTLDLYTPLVLSDGGASYIESMLVDGKVMRWTKQEITVSLDTSQVPAGWRPYCQYYVQDGLAQWEAAADGAFTFTTVSSNADIRIEYVHYIPAHSGITAGNTKVTFGYNTFSRPVITLAIDNLSDIQVHASAIHEIGHALGLMGHSPNSADIMTAGTYATELTSNDIATLLDVYRRPAELLVETW